MSLEGYFNSIVERIENECGDNVKLTAESPFKVDPPEGITLTTCIYFCIFISDKYENEYRKNFPLFAKHELAKQILIESYF